MKVDRFNDAWIFLSIGDAGGCDRQLPPDELASWADSNNHSIPTASELRVALSNLFAAGLIAVAGDSVAFTEAGCAAYRNANSYSGGHIDRMFALASQWSERFPHDIRSMS